MNYIDEIYKDDEITKQTFTYSEDPNVDSTMIVFPGANHSIGESDAIKSDLIPKFAALVTKDADNTTL